MNTKNDFDWGMLPELIGIVVILLLFGIVYILLLSGLIYLVMAGIAYIFKLELPKDLQYFILGWSTILTIWRGYRLVKS